MQILNTAVNLTKFFDHAADASLRLLLLDYDGTLAPFTKERDHAVPYPEIRVLLPELLDLPRTRTVIVSGRAIADLTKLIGDQPLPDLWGSQGWEFRSYAGYYTLFPLPADLRERLDQGAVIVRALSIPNVLEEKPASVAAHWRGKTFDETRILYDSVYPRVYPAWKQLEIPGRLQVKPFDGGIELRPTERDKGFVVNEIFSSINGDAVCAYLGDDATDEDAFRALKGRGLRVLVRAEYRETEADIRIAPPDELLEFLATWTETCRRQ